MIPGGDSLRYARIMLVASTDLGEASWGFRATEALRLAGHAVLPLGDPAALDAAHVAVAAASFGPTAVVFEQTRASLPPDLARAFDDLGCAVIECKGACGPDRAYWELRASKEPPMRRGVACTQRFTPQGAERLKRACDAAHADLTTPHPSWEESAGRARPGRNPAFDLRQTAFAVSFDADDTPTDADVALRIAEGNIVLCQKTALKGVGSPALRDALVPFEADGFIGCMRDLEGDARRAELVRAAQESAARALEELGACLGRKLCEANEARERRGEPAVLAYGERVVQVGLFGWFGAQNFGDDLLMRLAIDRVASRYANAYVWIVGAYPAVIRAAFGYEAFEPSQKFQIAQMLRGTRALAYCGGLVFDDPMATTAGDCEFLLDPWIEPAGQASIALLARNYGARPVYFCGGAGPVLHDATRTSLRMMGAAGTLFLCRDQQTCDCVATSGVEPGQICLRADLAYGCRGYLESRASDVIPGRLEQGGYFMVSLRAWPQNPAGFDTRMARALDAVVAATGLTAVFVPFDAKDAALHARVAAHMERARQKVVFGERPSEGDFFALVQGSSFAVAMRLHCSVLHHVLGKPAVGLNYNPKVAAHFKKVGELERLVDLDVDPACLADVAIDAWTARDAISARVLPLIEEGARLVDKATDELCAAIEDSRAAMEPARVCYPRTVGRQTIELGRQRHVAGDERARRERVERELGRERDEAKLLREELAKARAELAEARCAEADCAAERDALAREIENIHAARSYKLGRALTALPYNARAWWRRHRG